MKAFIGKPGDGPAFTDCDRIPGYVFGRPTEEYAALWAMNEAVRILAETEPAGSVSVYPRVLKVCREEYFTPAFGALAESLADFTEARS